MEMVDLTYLELVNMIEMGIEVFNIFNESITQSDANDLFFLEEEVPQEFYITNVEIYR